MASPRHDHDQDEAPSGDTRRWQLPCVATLLVAGLVAWAVGWAVVSDLFLVGATLAALGPAGITSLRDLSARRPGVDVVAVLAMTGALALGEHLAGAIIALMLTGGEALEAHAAGRARRELTELLGREPRRAHRSVPGGPLVDIDVDEVEVGDVLVVKRGEVVPTDGWLLSDQAVLDESALTGEPRPVHLSAGAPVPSGVVNSGGPIEVRATAAAASSTYRGIIRLVEQAATERAPFVRMADRFASWFVGATLLLAAGAWVVSGDPIRALAVLVVATPCPLILAAPAAIVGGLSRAARQGIIIKGGAALEALAAGEVVLLDKTGTVTTGRPRVTQVTPFGSIHPSVALRLAASLDQVSVHPFAPAIVAAAQDQGLELTFPTEVEEQLGKGIRGQVQGVEVALGQLEHVTTDAPPAALQRLQRRSGLEGTSLVYLAADGVLLAAITLHDPLRGDAAGAIRALRRSGMHHVLMVTGDRLEVAELVGDTLGVDEVLADRKPQDKLAAVNDARVLGPTIMVGDGVNDAPALALADSGVAMGARGATAASEAADVVITTGELRSLVDAVGIARRTRRIAWQSVVVGMGLSGIAMVAAAAGHLSPVAGALLQEVIDLAVIANALRALGSQRRGGRTQPGPLPAHILDDHRALAADVRDLSDVADGLPELDGRSALMALHRLRSVLIDRRLPHDSEEEAIVYPVFAPSRDAQDPTAPLARSRREIGRRIRLFARLVDGLPEHGPTPEDVIELQRSLWSLHAVLEMHDLLEDDLHARLTVVGPTTGRGRDPGHDARTPTPAPRS